MGRILEPLAIDQPQVRQALTAFLAPHEIRTLFLLGNLRRNLPGQHLYVAREGARWQAVAGFYASAHSLIPFAPPGAAPEVLAELTPRIAAWHPDVEWYLGDATMARPGLTGLQAAGRPVVNDPLQVFMQRDGLPAPVTFQERTRLMEPADHDEVAHLLRWLRAGKDDGRPITAEERADLALNADRVVLEMDGKIVATAASNGLGIQAYQVLGVATDPACRGRGYAGAVVAGLMNHMAAQGGRQVVLFTRHDNMPAIRCYQKLGFTITGEYLLARLGRPAGAR